MITAEEFEIKNIENFNNKKTDLLIKKNNQLDSLRQELNRGLSFEVSFNKNHYSDTVRFYESNLIGRLWSLVYDFKGDWDKLHLDKHDINILLKEMRAKGYIVNICLIKKYFSGKGTVEINWSTKNNMNAFSLLSRNFSILIFKKPACFILNLIFNKFYCSFWY